MEFKKPQKGVLIIDVGSASVGAALVREKNGVPLLEQVKRVPIGAGSKETRDALQERMLAAFKELVASYAGDLREVRIVTASPWNEARIRTVHSKTEKPSAVSIQTIEKTIDQYKNEAPPASGNIDLEAVAVQVRVNGYTTALAEPVMGSAVRINLYESEMSESLQRSLIEAVQEHLPRAHVSTHTFPLIAGAGLRLISDEKSFLFVDVGGEVTDLGIMHTDGVHFLATLPIGYWSLMRDMGGEQVGDMSSRMTLWIKNELSPEEEVALSQKFEPSFKKWITELENALVEASDLVPIPRTLFLLSDKEPIGWFKKGIELYGTKNLEPTGVQPAMLQRFVEIGEEASFDTFISLAALFFHTGEDEVVGEPTPAKVVYSR